MVAIELHKYECHFCKKKMLHAGFTSIVLDLRKFQIKRDNWSLGGLCVNTDNPIYKTCMKKVKNMFL